MNKMFGSFAAFLVLSLSMLYSTDSFKFSITKKFVNSKALDPKFWSHVEIDDECMSESVTLKVQVPRNLSKSCPTISVFFANDEDNILEVNMTKTVNAIFYTIPHRVQSKMEGSETTENITSDFYNLSCQFSRSWLPKNYTKVSAAVVVPEMDEIYNYYSILNYDISIFDLMVLDEYKPYTCGS